MWANSKQTSQYFYLNTRNMSDKAKPSTEAKTFKGKSKTTASVPSTSRKQKVTRPKQADVVDAPNLKQEHGLTDFGIEYSKIEYDRFMRKLLDECFLDEKIEREETEMDLKMAQLADRFQKTMNQLDKTNRRLKDISFVVEQKRLLYLKTNDCSQFYKSTEESNAPMLIEDLSNAEQAHLNKINLENVDFGYDKNSGHKQLLDAVNEAIEGLAKIKTESNLDVNKFAEYDRSKHYIDGIEKYGFDVDSIKSEFESKFPELSEEVMLESSKMIVKMIQKEEDDD